MFLWKDTWTGRIVFIFFLAGVAWIGHGLMFLWLDTWTGQAVMVSLYFTLLREGWMTFGFNSVCRKRVCFFRLVYLCNR